LTTKPKFAITDRLTNKKKQLQSQMI